ncbi:MAG: DMT family transporter [Syntrophothermus sp.]
MNNNRKAYIYALMAIACWSTIGSAFKISLRYLDFIHLLLFSSVSALLVLFIIILFQGKSRLLKNLQIKDYVNSAVMGGLNPFLYYLVLLRSYELLPAQEAGTLNYIWPLVLVLLSIPMLRQKISKWSILAIFISFMGIMLISTHGEIMNLKFSNPFGVLLATGSALFWALFWILNIRDHREEVTKLFLNFCFGTLYILITVLILHSMGKLPFSFDFHGLAGSLYLGIFEMGVTFVLWLNALKYATTTAKVSNLIYLSPFISLFLIHIFVGEKILVSTIAGLAFITAGIILQQKLRY